MSERERVICRSMRRGTPAANRSVYEPDPEAQQELVEVLRVVHKDYADMDVLGRDGDDPIIPRLEALIARLEGE